MAEAATEFTRFFCHSCNMHFATNSTELKCPNCESGFVEQMERSPNDEDSQSSDVDRGNSSGPTAMDMLRSSLLHYWPSTVSPDLNPDSVSFFSINFQPDPETSRGNARSNEQQNASTSNPASGNERSRYNLRIRSRRRRPSQPSTPGDSNLLLEGFLQQLLSGSDPRAMFGGEAANLFGNIFPLHGNPGDYAWGENGLDDVITQLLGRLDNTGPPPASTNTINELPVLTITKEHVEGNKECSVCMETFIVDVKAKKLPCEHFFHINCIDQWLELHNTCPICRKNIEDFSSCPRAASHSARSTSGPSTSGV